MPSNNRVIVAAAGSGKTTTIIGEALSFPEEKIAILTYTNNNLNEIKNKFYQENGFIPENITIQTWFSFLLDDCVRPYQNYVYGNFRIESLVFVNYRSAKFISKTNISQYYLSEKNIYSDKVSEFAILCNTNSDGLVIKRLEKIYTKIYIDEIQDMAGYDLDLIEMIANSKIDLTLVGDNRQATFSTNSSAKNDKYKGFEIINLFKIWEASELFTIDYQSISYRCSQPICDIADSLYPEMPKTKSLCEKVSDHDGVFIVSEEQIDDYINKYHPSVLRYDRRTSWHNSDIMNFGESKGLTFQRVLIIPNNPIKEFLKTGEIKHVQNEREKLYVAITRAINSVAFLYNGNNGIANIKNY